MYTHTPVCKFLSIDRCGGSAGASQCEAPFWAEYSSEKTHIKDMYPSDPMATGEMAHVAVHNKLATRRATV